MVLTPTRSASTQRRCSGPPAGWAPTSVALLSVEALYVDNAGDDTLGLHTQFKTIFGNDD